MPEILVINIFLFFLIVLKNLKEKKFIVVFFVSLFFINIWIPLFFNYNSEVDLYLGNSNFYIPIAIWLSFIYLLIYVDPFRFYKFNTLLVFKKKLLLNNYSTSFNLILFVFVFLFLLLLGTSNIYLVVLISSIAAVLTIKNNIYTSLFFLIFILLAGSFQRSLILPLVFLFFLKLYSGKINIKHILYFSASIITIFYVALVGRGLQDAISFKEIINGLIVSEENLSILTSNISNVNIGSVAFEMRSISKLTVLDIIDYFINILIPIPSSFSSFDFQKYYVSRYLGTEPTLGLPMPACYQIYFFFGHLSILIMYLIFRYLKKIDNVIRFQFDNINTNIFTFISLFFITLALIYFHHSDLRIFVVCLLLSFVSVSLSKYVKFKSIQ
jgi:hypothetical protein